jgi:hypothetical protein
MGGENLSVTMAEEQRGYLRSGAWEVIGLRREEVKRGNMKWYEELHNSYNYRCQGDEMEEDEMSGKCGMHGRDEKCIPISVRKPEG